MNYILSQYHCIPRFVRFCPNFHFYIIFSSFLKYNHILVFYYNQLIYEIYTQIYALSIYRCISCHIHPLLLSF
nr:MAG TPA: hypothetical protein [Caudoviricetes sp.]